MRDSSTLPREKKHMPCARWELALDQTPRLKKQHISANNGTAWNSWVPVGIPRKKQNPQGRKDSHPLPHHDPIRKTSGFKFFILTVLGNFLNY